MQCSQFKHDKIASFLPVTWKTSSVFVELSSCNNCSLTVCFFLLIILCIQYDCSIIHHSGIHDTYLYLFSHFTPQLILAAPVLGSLVRWDVYYGSALGFTGIILTGRHPGSSLIKYHNPQLVPLKPKTPCQKDNSFSVACVPDLILSVTTQSSIDYIKRGLIESDSRTMMD